LCMPDELYNRIIRWVEQGGILVMAGGVMGNMNQYGQHATHRPNFFNATVGEAALPQRPADATVDQDPRTWHAALGRGMIYLTSHVSNQIMQLVKTHHQPRVTTG